jgi:hypothetical protein
MCVIMIGVTRRLVDWLQHSDFAGVIFTRDKWMGRSPSTQRE